MLASLTACGEDIDQIAEIILPGRFAHRRHRGVLGVDEAAPRPTGGKEMLMPIAGKKPEKERDECSH